MSNLGDLQIDKSIKEYCEKVWTTPQVEVPKPSLSKDDRVRSSNNLLLLGNNGSRSQDFKNQLLNGSDDDSASLTKEDLEGTMN